MTCKHKNINIQAQQIFLAPTNFRIKHKSTIKKTFHQTKTQTKAHQCVHICISKQNNNPIKHKPFNRSSTLTQIFTHNVKTHTKYITHTNAHTHTRKLLIE